MILHQNLLALSSWSKMNKKIKKILNKKNKSKIICLTAYSKNIAQILDKHCDLVLVGDSLGSVLYNYKSTKEVTLQTMKRPVQYNLQNVVLKSYGQKKRKQGSN